MRIAAVLLLVGGLACGAASVCAGITSTPGAGRTGAAADTLGGAGEEKDKQAIKEEMARIAGREVPGPRKWEREKSPTVAMVSSMVLPGLGQLYNGRRIKTAIAVGAFTYYLGSAWFEQKKAQEYLVERDSLPSGSVEWTNADILYQFHKDNSVTYLWWSGAVWLITVLDAFVDAHLYDVRAVKPAAVTSTSGANYIALSVEF